MHAIFKTTFMAFFCAFLPISTTHILPIEYAHTAKKQNKKIIFLLEKIIHKHKKNDSIEHIISLQKYLKNYCFDTKADPEKTQTQLNLLLKHLLIGCRTTFETVPVDIFLAEYNNKTSDTSILEIIADNNNLLCELEKEIIKRTIPLYSQIIDTTDSFLESISFYTIVKRALPYAALAGYIQATQPYVLDVFLQNKQAEEKKQTAPITFHVSAPKIIGQGLLKIHEKPLLELSIYSLFLPTLKKDASDLVSYATFQAQKITALLKNKPIPSQKISKKSSVKLNDIIGKQEIKNILQKNIMQAPDSERGFLFIGDPSSAKECAYALAGEIKECEMYEIDASSLVSKNLKETIKTINPQSPLVIIIDNIDWILEEQNYNTKTVSEFIETIKAFVHKNKKEYIVVIGIASTAKNITEKFKEQTKLNSVIYFAKPSLQERFAFFKKKTAKNSTELYQEIDLNYLAGATEGTSYETLTKIYNEALSSANLNKELLNPSHFEMSLDRHIRFIIADEQQIPLGKKRLKAAQYAGHVIAQKILFPESNIAKATLFLVKTAQDTYENGALFSYTTHDEQKTSSSNYVQKKILYLLIGKEAQKMLHNDYDQPSCQLLTQEAYQKAYELLLEGIKEETLDSKTKEDLKQAAWKIYTTLSKEAQNFVEEHKQIIQKIAELLEEKTTISLKEIDEIYL